MEMAGEISRLIQGAVDGSEKVLGALLPLLGLNFGCIVSLFVVSGAKRTSTTNVRSITA